MVSMSSGIASLHKILKDETRRKIVLLLNEKGSLSYTDLMNSLEIVSTGLLNYHLKVLGALLTKNGEGRYALTEKGKLASRLLLEFPEENRMGKPKWWRRFWIEALIFVVIVASVISAAYFFGYIGGNGVYQGIVSMVSAIGVAYMIQHILRDVLSKRSQLVIAETAYVAGGVVLGLGIAFFGGGVLLRALQDFTGEPLLYAIFWSNWYLVFALLIAPAIGGIAMYQFGKKRRFRTANYNPDA